MPEWVFQKTPEMGGATGEAYRNTLNAGGLGNEKLLAREALQNSVDAHLGAHETAPPRIRFTRLDVLAERVADFDHLLALSAGLGPRSAQLGLPQGNLLEALARGNVDIPNLLIEDWNAVGLGGSLKNTTKDSHFRNLLFELGYGTKARESASSGGSYGFGKSVYSKASSIRTIFVYSRFAPTKETGGVSSRFMGCGYFEAHELDGETYTGRAWFGAKRSESLVEPLTNQVADEFAEKLGIAPRGQEETGTSILILGCGVDLDEIRRGIEDFWWPRLIEHELEVELFDGDVEMDPPRPKQRQELLPFIECYELVNKRAESTSDAQYVGGFHSINGRSPGSYAVCALPSADGEDESIEVDNPFANVVALMRQPRMVVQYAPMALDHLEPIAGVFVADDSVDRTLKLSEPGLHNQWDEKSDRLSPEEAELVRTILKRLRQNVRNFQRQLRPPPPKQDGRVRELERLFGRFLKTTDRDKQKPPPPGADPIMIHWPAADRKVIDGKATVEGRVRMQLRDSADRPSQRAVIRITANVLVDDTRVKGDAIPVTLTLGPGTEAAEVEGNKILAELFRDQPIEVGFRTDAHDASWVCQLEADAETAGE